jgi:hypothetical protein
MPVFSDAAGVRGNKNQGFSAQKRVDTGGHKIYTDPVVQNILIHALLSEPLFLKSLSMKGGPWASPETVAPPVFGKETR